MSDTTEPLASVIIPSFNQKKVIFDALESVFKQRTDFSFEVIVVESTGDDTAALVRQRYPVVRVIELAERAYPGTARNAAIKEARGQYLAFTDTDCIVDPLWLQELVDSHRQGHDVIGGIVRNGTPFSITGTLDYLLEFSDLITPYPATDKTHFGTCNVSFQTEVFKKFGMFADQVKGSDSIYTRLLVKNGQPLFYQPKAKIWHRNRTRLGKIIRNQYELGYGAAINRHKYDLSGKVFVRYPLLIPLLPFAKYTAISGRLFRYSFFDFLKFLMLFPLAFVVLCFYAAGFYRGHKKILGKNNQER